jgi:nucleoid DNA-binding protein
MKKQLINEVKRMQQLAGIITENEITSSVEQFTNDKEFMESFVEDMEEAVRSGDLIILYNKYKEEGLTEEQIDNILKYIMAQMNNYVEKMS